MADEVVRVIRVRGVPEGLENLTAQLKRAEQAYSGVGTAASGAGTATETSARKLNTTERSYRSLTERLDSTARLYRQLQTDTRTLSGAFDAGFMGKGAEAAARFNAQLTQIQRNLQDVGGKMATGGGLSASLDSIFDMRKSGGSARDAASVFETEFQRLDTIAQQKAVQIGAEFGRELTERLTTATGKSAREAASVFEAEMSRLDDIARQRASQVGQEFQRALNERLVTGSGKSASASASVFQEMFADEDAQARTLEKLRQQYDPLSVAQERYANAIAETNKFRAAGQITEQQHFTITANARKVLEDTTKAYNGAFVAQDKYASGTGLARHELINLSRQLQDVGVSLASGQSPLTVLIQQGTQIADVFAASRASVSSFFAQAARGVAGFAMSGAGLATGGALAGGAALLAGYQYGESQREIERSLAGVGRQSGVTLAAVNRLADGYADAAKVSTATAREMIAAFAGTGKVDAATIGGTARLTKDFAAQFSLSATDAAKQLAGAFADPTSGAVELNKQIGFLDARTLEYIRTMQAQGRLGDAQKAMADALGQSVQGAADRTSGLAKAWNAVWNAASGAWDAIGKAVGGQTSAEERLARAIAERAKMNDGGRAGSMWSRWSAGERAQAEAEVEHWQEVIRRQGQLDAERARSARTSAASTGALSVLDEISPFGAELRKLDTMASALKKGLEEASGALNPDQARQVAEAFERVSKARQLALTPAQQERALGDLAVKSAEARTLQERAGVEIARLQLDSAFRMLETEQQRERVNRTILELQAQANREARDALRSSQDQAALAGLRPYERRMREIEFRERDNRERFGGQAVGNFGYGAGGYTGQGPFLNPVAALPATAGAMRGLDAAFAANLTKLVQEFPGLTITSGFRTYEQQARLYAEKPHLAAPPGRSNHERGNAVDLAYRGSSNLPDAIHQRARELDIAFPLAHRARNPERWHAEPAGARGDTASTIAQNERAAAATEQYNSIIRTANDNLKEQQQELDRVAQSYGKTAGQIAEAQTKQQLYNQFTQAGASVSADAAKEIDRLAAAYGRVADGMARVKLNNDLRFERDQIGRSTEDQAIASRLRSSGLPVDLQSAEADSIRLNMQLTETKDILSGAAKGFVADLRSGKSVMESLAGLADRISTKLLDKAIDVGVSALFKGFTLGFADGGYTGAGGKYQPAGIVHAGEYVFSQASVNRIGLGNLDRLHKGYDAGGYVTPLPTAQPFIHRPQPANSNSGPARTTVNVNVVGATGNQEVQRMVAAGVAQGMQQTKAEMPGYLAKVQQRAG